MNDNKIGYVTQRTRQAKLMELVAAVIVVLTWALVAVVFARSPQDGTSAMTSALGGTVATALIMGLVYAPHTFNMPRRNPKREHYDAMVAMLRVVGIEVAVLILGVVLATLFPVVGGALSSLMGVAMTVTVVIYYVRMCRIK